MASDAQIWLSVAAAGAGACGGPASATAVRFRDLRPRQKRELSALTAAGLCLSALMCVPAIMPAAEEETLAATTLRIQLAAAPALLATSAVERAPQPVRARRVPRPQVLTAHAIPTRPLQVSMLAPPTHADHDTEAHTPTPRGGAILRALVGDGRHRVQPFPTPAGRNPSFNRP